MNNKEEKWLNDELIAKQMDGILDKLNEVYPDFDVSEYREKAKKDLIPNPFVLEKSDSEELKILAGLIHREYAMLLVLGIVNAKITEDGRAIVEMDGVQEDITNSLMELIPHIATACGFAIQDLSITDNWSKEIDELLQILSLTVYYAVALRNMKLLEDLILVIVYISRNAKEPTRTKLVNKIKEDFRNMGLENLGSAFDGLIRNAM